jgi:hypothetical protein
MENKIAVLLLPLHRVVSGISAAMQKHSSIGIQASQVQGGLKRLNRSRRFKNTFAPYVENKELPLEAIIRLLFMGFPISQLPEEIQLAVREEMELRKHQQKAGL